jgi:hypothetical protein
MLCLMSFRVYTLSNIGKNLCEWLKYFFICCLFLCLQWYIFRWFLRLEWYFRSATFLEVLKSVWRQYSCLYRKVDLLFLRQKNGKSTVHISSSPDGSKYPTWHCADPDSYRETKQSRGYCKQQVKFLKY